MMEQCEHDWQQAIFKISLGQPGIGHFDSDYCVDANFAFRRCTKCGKVEVWWPDTRTREWMDVDFIIANAETPYMVWRKIDDDLKREVDAKIAELAAIRNGGK